MLLRLGVVVREDELALGAVDLAGRLIHDVARREHVRRHRIVVDAPDDVRGGGAQSARVSHRVARRDDRRIAEEAHEAARQVDERGGVALVAASREETVGTHRSRRREGVEARDRRAVSQHERDLHRAGTGDEEHLVQVRRAADDLDVAVGARLGRADRGERRVPVDLARLAREAGEELAHLRVRRLLGDHAPDRPRRKRPRHGRRGRARGRVSFVRARAGSRRGIRRRGFRIVPMAEDGYAGLLHAYRAVRRGVCERSCRAKRRNGNDRREFFCDAHCFTSHFLYPQNVTLTLPLSYVGARTSSPGRTNWIVAGMRKVERDEPAQWITTTPSLSAIQRR